MPYNINLPPAADSSNGTQMAQLLASYLTKKPEAKPEGYGSLTDDPDWATGFDWSKADAFGAPADIPGVSSGGYNPIYPPSAAQSSSY